MDKISFRRYFAYWGRVIAYTFRYMWGYVMRIRNDFLGVVLPIVIYFVVVLLGSQGLLKVDLVNQYTAPLGDFAQLVIATIFILFTMLVILLFETPARLYYEQKKLADKNNWNDVSFGEILPKYRNLLGISIVVKNNKMTPLEDFSVTLVEIWPEDYLAKGERKMFGYVEKYETDKHPIFQATKIEEEKETTFIVANYDENNRFMVRAKSDINPEIELPKENAYVLDIEFNARGMPTKLIRYTFVFTVENENLSCAFQKYEVKKHKKFWN